MNLLNIAIAKKAKTFFNKFVPQARRSSTALNLKMWEKTLDHSLCFDDLRISAISKFDSISEFQEMTVNLEEWYNQFTTIGKGINEVQYLPVQTGNTTILTMDGVSLSGAIPDGVQSSALLPWETVATIPVAMALVNAIGISNAVATNGLLPINTQVFFHIKENEMKILNTNDVVLHQNVIPDIEGKEFIFAIGNGYMAKLKQFLAFGNGVGEISISVCDKQIMFSYPLKEFEARFICPFKQSPQTEQLFYSLEKIMNVKYFGKPVTLDENDMYQKGVEAHVAWMYRNNKITGKLTQKDLKAELDKFTATANKQEAFKNMDKNKIKLEFLSLDKSIEKPDLYINRIMYTNYIAMIQDLPYSVYCLNTKAEALMFGSNDEALRFKTLFMLRRPKDEIEMLTDEDLEAMENAKEEVSLKEEDDDTFVPT